MKVAVIGSGYVGLTTGICLARGGNEVILMDIDKSRVRKLRKGKLPIYEHGLNELFDKARKEKRIKSTSNYRTAIKDSDLSFVCVGTPSRKDGSINLRNVREACKSIGKELRKKRDGHTVAIRSTVVPGTTEAMIYHLQRESGKKAGKDFGVAVHPEHLAEGSAVENFLHPDKIVIGQLDEDSGDDVLRPYFGAGVEINDDNIYRLSLREAEMEKYFSNAYLATRVSFANEMANICERFGVDYFKVRDVACKDRRLDGSFTVPGLGFGGSCFPKDLKALMAAAEKEGYSPKLLKEVLNVNKRQPHEIARLIDDLYEVKSKKIAILGVTFKGETDDLRETPVKPFVEHLRKLGAKVLLCDPLAKEKEVKKEFGSGLTPIHGIVEKANLIVLAADHKQFKEEDMIFGYELVKDEIPIFDAKNMLDGRYRGFGRLVG